MSIPDELRREKLLDAARGYLTLEMPDHALSELDDVPKPEESFFDWNLLRGEALRQKTDYHEALKSYSYALAEKPDDLTVILGMAWCYKRTDQLDKAIAALEELSRSCSDDAIVQYNLACYFALDGNKDQALSWLGRALRTDGSYRKLIANETDFDQLRDDPDFQFVAGIGANLRERS